MRRAHKAVPLWIVIAALVATPSQWKQGEPFIVIDWCASPDSNRTELVRRGWRVVRDTVRATDFEGEFLRRPARIRAFFERSAGFFSLHVSASPSHYFQVEDTVMAVLSQRYGHPTSRRESPTGVMASWRKRGLLVMGYHLVGDIPDGVTITWVGPDPCRARRDTLPL